MAPDLREAWRTTIRIGATSLRRYEKEPVSPQPRRAGNLHGNVVLTYRGGTILRGIGT